MALFFCLAAYSQDERYFRQLFTGELEPFKIEEKTFKYVIRSQGYQLDINDNGFLESIYLAKKDGLDYIDIEDFEGTKVFEGRLYSYGPLSKVYKITKTKISKHTNVLIIHYYEGKTDSRRFEATARLYFLSYDKKDGHWGLAQGPNFFHEKELSKKRYWNRDYHININDFDANGIKEISVSYNHINRVYKYQGKGVWSQF